MPFDYYADRYARACLKEAAKSKAEVNFGAVLVCRGKIMGRGRNRRANNVDRRLLSYVDCAIHAEQACVIDAIRQGWTKKELIVLPCRIYVLGFDNVGRHQGKLTTRKRKEFICKKCPPSVLLRFNIPVYIPHIDGWLRMSPEEAMQTGRESANKGRWKQFITTGSVEEN